VGVVGMRQLPGIGGFLPAAADGSVQVGVAHGNGHLHLVGRVQLGQDAG